MNPDGSNVALSIGSLNEIVSVPSSRSKSVNDASVGLSVSGVYESTLRRPSSILDIFSLF